MAFTANNTYFPSEQPRSPVKDTATKVGEKLGFSSWLKKGDKVSKNIEKAIDPGEPEDSPAQVTRAFQPVHWVVPPGSEMWVNEKNTAYVNSLAELRQALLAISRSTSPTPDPALHQQALAAYDKALEAVRQLAIGFKPVGAEGVDAEVRGLLEAPIREARHYIQDDPKKFITGKANAYLAALCAKVRPLLLKYPFAQSANYDASLDEIAALFAPATGVIWKYQQDSLGEFVIKQGPHWVPKPDAKIMISNDVLTFLNRAQALSNAFYPPGSNQPLLRYTLRPQSAMSLDVVSVVFEFDGRHQVFSKESRLQKEFVWPAPPGSRRRDSPSARR
jgi:type VI protein secretion system component VasK